MVKNLDSARSEDVSGTSGRIFLGSVVPPALSQRELEIASLLLLGKTNKEIAKHLYVSPETVKTHLGNILRKLGARNRTEAAIKASEQVEKANAYPAARLNPIHEMAAENGPDYLRTELQDSETLIPG